MRAPMLCGLLPLLALLAGCQCSPFGVETTRFVCTTSADCITGFECLDVGAGLECVRSGTGDAGPGDAGRLDGGSDAGGDAGDVDAGDVDAGEVDAGDVDAGDVDAGEVDAGDVDAGFDAGVDAGNDAGPGPVALRFATAAQTVVAGGCTQIIGIETLGADGGVLAVPSATPVTLSAAPGSVTFFSASNCTGPSTTSITIGVNLASGSFYASPAGAQANTLTVSSPPMTPASQQLVSQNPPTSLVFTSTPPNPVRGGTCLSATLEGRRGGTATPVVTTTSIGLSVVGGARFYSDAACTTTTATASMGAGSSTAGFFFKPLTGGTNVLSASAPFGTATQNIVTTPIVRRGQCSFAARVGLPDGGSTSELSANCAVSPALSDLTASVLFTQATAVVSGTELGVAEVRCRLSSTSNVLCFRREDLDPADVHFQVAEVPQGMLVQRASSFSCPATISLTTPVNTARSFVLKAVASQTVSFDDEDAAIAALLDPVTVSLTPTSCAGSDVQVADWSGLTVTRGMIDGGMPTGVASLTVSGLPAASTNRALIIQPGTTVNGARPVCSTMVRGAMPSASSIVLTRSVGDGGCPVTPLESLLYERIDFGTRGVVHEYTATFPPGTTSRAVAVTPVDTSRTLVFASSEIAGGQGSGETDHEGTALFTEAAFQLVLTNSTTVTATRAASTSTATVTFYVAELLP